MVELTPQEVNEKMALIMGWYIGYDLTKSPAVPRSYLDKDEIYQMSYSKWNPYEDLNHAFMVLHKWLEGHPERTYELGVGYYRNSNVIEVSAILFNESKTPNRNIFQYFAPKNHETQAICNCLMEATTI